MNDRQAQQATARGDVSAETTSLQKIHARLRRTAGGTVALDRVVASVNDGTVDSVSQREAPTLSCSVIKLREIHRDTNAASNREADPVCVRLTFADGVQPAAVNSSQANPSPSVSPSFQHPRPGSADSQPHAPASHIASQLGVAVGTAASARGEADLRNNGPAQVDPLTPPPPPQSLHPSGSKSLASIISSRHRYQATPSRSGSSPLRRRLERLTAAAQSAARAVTSVIGRDRTFDRDLPSSIHHSHTSTLIPSLATPSSRSALTDLKFASRENRGDIDAEHALFTPVAPRGKMQTPTTARTRRLTSENQELRSSMASVVADKSRLMVELANTRQQWQEAQQELGRLSASRTAAEVARADAQMARKALQKEREWRQQISETLAKREKEAADAVAASEKAHQKARQLEHHTHELAEETSKWRTAAEAMQKHLARIPHLEGRCREQDAALETARSAMALLEDKLQAEITAKRTAEASAADREAALAAAHRQLSLKAGSAEAQHLDMQAQCTFLEAALKESRQQAQDAQRQLTLVSHQQEREARSAASTCQDLESQLLASQIRVKELESRCAVLDAQVADLSSVKVELCSRMAAENGAAQEARCDATALEARVRSLSSELSQMRARADAAEGAWKQEAERASILERGLSETRDAAAAAHQQALQREAELQEKTSMLRELEAEGTHLCRRVQELLEAEGDQRERASQLASALESERRERQALDERFQESRTLLSAQQTQLRLMQQQKGPQQRTPQISGHGTRTPRTPERLKHSLEAALQQRDSLAQDVARLQKEADSALEANRRLSQELQAAQTTQGKVQDNDSKKNAPPGPKEQRNVENGRLSLEVKLEERDKALQALQSAHDALRMELAAREAELEIFQAKLVAARTNPAPAPKDSETVRLSSALEEAERIAEATAKRLEQEIAAHAVCTADKEGLAAQLQQMLSERQRLSAACSHLATEHEGALSQLELLREEARRREVEVDALQARLGAGREAMARVKALEVEAVALRTHAAQAGQVEAQLQTLKIELEQAELRGRQVQEAGEKAQKQMQERLQQLEKERDALAEEAKTLRPLRTYASHIQSLEQKVQEKEAQLSQARAEAGQATMAASTLPDMKAQLASTRAALAQSTADAKAWEERAVGVEAIAARVPGLEATVREKEVLVESLRAELEEALRVELEEAGGKVPLSLQAARVQASTLATEKAAVEVELERAKGDVASLKRTISDAKKTQKRLEAQVDELTRLLQAAAQQVEAGNEVRAELERTAAADAAAARARAADERAAAEKARSALEAKLASASSRGDSLAARCTALEAELSAKMAHAEQLAAKVQSLQGQVEGMSRAARAAQAKCASLEQALKAEQANPDSVSALRQEVGGLQASLREKTAALEEALRQLASERSQLDRLEAQLLCEATDEEEVARALEEAAHLRAELAVVSQARDEARAQLARFRAESVAPLERVAHLTAELQTAKAASAEHAGHVDRLSAALAAANSKVKDLEEEQQRQVSALRERGTASAQELERYSKQVAVLTATLKAREEEMEDLSSQVDLLKAQGGIADPESWLLP
eukprot:jgi/Botrbrau1/5728/Bobra.0134s0004.2